MSINDKQIPPDQVQTLMGEGSNTADVTNTIYYNYAAINKIAKPNNNAITVTNQAWIWSTYPLHEALQFVPYSSPVKWLEVGDDSDVWNFDRNSVQPTSSFPKM